MTPKECHQFKSFGFIMSGSYVSKLLIVFLFICGMPSFRLLLNCARAVCFVFVFCFCFLNLTDGSFFIDAYRLN